MLYLGAFTASTWPIYDEIRRSSIGRRDTTLFRSAVDIRISDDDEVKAANPQFLVLKTHGDLTYGFALKYRIIKKNNGMDFENQYGKMHRSLLGESACRWINPNPYTYNVFFSK